MKAHLIKILVIDHEGMGADSIADLLSDNRYVSAMPAGSEAFEIGEWRDSHPLNLTTTDVEAWLDVERAKETP